MQELIQGLTFGTTGYVAAYMLLRPEAFFDALKVGPGMGSAGWAYHLEHKKMTFAALAMMLAVLILALLQLPHSTN